MIFLSTTRRTALTQRQREGKKRVKKEFTWTIDYSAVDKPTGLLRTLHGQPAVQLHGSGHNSANNMSTAGVCGHQNYVQDILA